MFDLSDKRVFVTGASSGLGQHFAGVLARAGADVTIGARRMEQLGTSIYRWQNVAWDDSLLPDSGGSRCVNRDFSDYRII